MSPKEEFRKLLISHAQTCDNMAQRFTNTRTSNELRDSAFKYRKRAREL